MLSFWFLFLFLFLLVLVVPLGRKDVGGGVGGTVPKIMQMITRPGSVQ
jgi:hypothetical protein